MHSRRLLNEYIPKQTHDVYIKVTTSLKKKCCTKPFLDPVDAVKSLVVLWNDFFPVLFKYHKKP